MASNHEALRLLVSGSLVALQPASGSGGKVETLSIDTASGDVRLTAQPALGGGSEQVLAVIGAFRLRAATVVAVVTGAQKVRGGGRRGSPVLYGRVRDWKRARGQCVIAAVTHGTLQWCCVQLGGGFEI